MSTRYLLSLQLLLIILCALEESLELNSLRQSQILCNFLRLIIELVASVFRIPVRLLVCFRLRKVSALNDFNRLAKHVCALLDLRTTNESILLAQAYQDEHDHIKHDDHMLRIQKKLARALDDASKLRRDNLALTNDFNDAQVDRATILCAVEKLAKPHGCAPDLVVQDRKHTSFGDRPLVESDDVLSSVRGRFDRLEQELRGQQARCSHLERELQGLQEHYRRINEELACSRSSHQETRNQLQALLQNCRSYQRTTRQVDSQRLEVIRSLTLALIVSLSFTRHLGLRLAHSMCGQTRVLSRWRVVSSQKVAARRELIKTMNANQDLRRKLEIQIIRRQHHEKWHTEYHKSVKARELAAKKFKAYHRHVTSRYTSTVTQLLTGLLVLWRLSLLLTQQLAEARILARALEESAIAHDKLVAEKEKSELRIRVGRLEEKIKAMESVDAAYLRILSEQTRPYEPHCAVLEQPLLSSAR